MIATTSTRSTLAVWAVRGKMLPSASVAADLQWGSTCLLATSPRATCVGAPEIVLHVEGGWWWKISAKELEQGLSQHCVPSDVE